MHMRRKAGLMAAQGTLLVCLLVPSLAFAANKPATPTQTAAQPAAPAPTDPTNGVGEFVPLTHLPQIQSLSQSQNFGTFVNTFYKILIGVGAVLAVLMIMYAGVQFMTDRGSVTTNEKAKSRIQNAIFGLILVLAPTIVFGIINPDILHLNLGTEFQQLKQDKGVDQSAFQSNVVGGSGSASSCPDPSTLHPVQGDMCPTGSQPTTQSCCGGGISATAICCAKKAEGSTTAVPAGGNWGWKAKFTGGGSVAGVYNQKGPFGTQKECVASQTAFIQGNSNLTLTEDQPCTCAQPMTKQPSCHL